MTVFLTVLAGVLTFVLGQIVLRLFVEPVLELKRTIADIAIATIKHANVYCNPGVTTVEKENEAARELKALASRLNAGTYLVSPYPTLQWLFRLPAKSNISQAMSHLIGISHSVHAGSERMATVNGKKSDKVCELLGIHLPDQDKEP